MLSSHRRVHSDLRWNWKLFLAYGCAKGRHLPNTDLLCQREDEGDQAIGGQHPRRVAFFWQDRDVEWKDAEDSSCIALYPGLQYHKSGVLTYGKPCAFLTFCIHFSLYAITHHIYKSLSFLEHKFQIFSSQFQTAERSVPWRPPPHMKALWMIMRLYQVLPEHTHKKISLEYLMKFRSLSANDLLTPQTNLLPLY